MHVYYYFPHYLLPWGDLLCYNTFLLPFIIASAKICTFSWIELRTLRPKNVVQENDGLDKGLVYIYATHKFYYSCDSVTKKEDNRSTKTGYADIARLQLRVTQRLLVYCNFKEISSKFMKCYLKSNLCES